MSRLLSSALILVAGGAGAGRAAAAPAPRFPLSASLRRADPMARDPFQHALDELFRAPAAGAEPDLIFDLVPDPGVNGAREGNRVYVAVEVVVSDPGSGEVGRFAVRGSADTLEHDPDSVARARGRAFEDAATHLQADLVESEPVVRWLMARGVTPLESTVLWKKRGDHLAFVDLGAGVMITNGLGPALTGRVGYSGKWFVAQGVFGLWSTPQESGVAGSSAVAVGVELGPVLRIGRNLEVRGGVGVLALWGSVDNGQASVSYTRRTPTVFGAIQYAISGRTWRTPSRLRVGFEVRNHFDSDAPIGEIREVVQVAGFYAGLFAGWEWPL